MPVSAAGPGHSALRPELRAAAHVADGVLAVGALEDLRDEVVDDAVERIGRLERGLLGRDPRFLRRPDPRGLLQALRFLGLARQTLGLGAPRRELLLGGQLGDDLEAALVGGGGARGAAAGREGEAQEEDGNAPGHLMALARRRRRCPFFSKRSGSEVTAIA